ncbi:MAG: hypothetical protein U5L08_04280 [Xanthomonadales bacterium]|nr:hypothetical protein [Xanthomonadales bacterium]
MNGRIHDPMALWGREMSQADTRRLIRSAGQLLDAVLDAAELLEEGESVTRDSEPGRDILALAERLTSPEGKSS